MTKDQKRQFLPPDEFLHTFEPGKWRQLYSDGDRGLILPGGFREFESRWDKDREGAEFTHAQFLGVRISPKGLKADVYLDNDRLVEVPESGEYAHPISAPTVVLAPGARLWVRVENTKAETVDASYGIMVERHWNGEQYAPGEEFDA